jgi:hypothetical protein
MRTQAAFRYFHRFHRNHSRRQVPALVAFAAFLSYACGGCLSNEYVIPKQELARLAQLPPEQRGQSVQIVQTIGDRRAEAIDTTQPPPQQQQQQYAQGQGYGPQPEGYVEEGPNVGVGVVIVAPFPPPLFPPLPGPGFGPGVGHGPRGPVGAVPGRAVPTAPRRPGTSGSGGGKLGSGSGKDDLVALLIVVAVLATIGMVATEGARYDGSVAMYPWQAVHLKDANGAEREVPLAQITTADVASASQAVVMDDEGWGMMRLGRRPLDHKGFAFKMDLGGMYSSTSTLSGSGFGTNIQFGYFPHHTFGLLGTWAFAGGSDANGDSFTRNNLALEAQVFPVSIWRLHLGGFGHGGTQYAHDALGGARQGAAFGGGLILELALTTRLALTARADYTSAHVAPDGGWAATQMFSAGVAIY